MRSTSQSAQQRKNSLVVVSLLALFFSTFGAGNSQSARAQEDATNTPAVEMTTTSNLTSIVAPTTTITPAPFNPDSENRLEYTVSYLGMTFSYPNTWSLQPLPYKDAGFRISSPVISVDPLGRPTSGGYLGAETVLSSNEEWINFVSNNPGEPINFSGYPGIRLSGIESEIFRYLEWHFYANGRHTILRFVSSIDDFDLLLPTVAEMVANVKLTGVYESEPTPSASRQLDTIQAWNNLAILHAFSHGPGKIIADYNAISHTGAIDYGLDICEGSGCSASTYNDIVYAPTDIKLVHSDNGFGMPATSRDYHFFEVAVDSQRKLCLAMGHFEITIPGFTNGKTMPRQAQIGRIITYIPSVNHIHMNLYSVPLNQGCEVVANRVAVPFDGTRTDLKGQSLDGVDYHIGTSYFGAAVTSHLFGACALPYDSAIVGGESVSNLASASETGCDGGGLSSDRASFVTDVTIPDGTTMSPGQTFTKTWRMRNTGVTNWGSGYSWVFTSGSQMNAPASISVPSTSPNNTADLSVSMVAPTTPGGYQGNWRMRNPQGQLFGDAVWVKINVSGSPGSCTNGAISAPLQSGYQSCSTEGGTCNLSSQASVAYGANSCFFYQTFPSSVSCSNATFGDPISGTQKACYYKTTNPPPSGNWRVEYFNSRDLNNRCYEGYENSSYIFKNWGTGSPASGCNSDNFSARFTSNFNFSGGHYNFHCQHDDGCRIYIDGQRVGDWWWDSPFDGHDWGGSLSGTREVRIEFYDAGGEARLEAFWSGAGFLPSGPGCTSSEWCATYYGNKLLAGTPAINRSEGTGNINYDWGSEGIGFGFPNDNFSVRWQRNVYFPAGRYRFYIRMDDGGKLWINSDKVIDEWRDQGASDHPYETDLGAGEKTIKFEYYENGGGAVAKLWWETLQLYYPPSANFDTFPWSGNAPLTTRLHIVSMDNITSCSWDYGDGQTSTTCTQLHDHTYTNPGSYTVTLTVDGPGGSHSVTRPNYITANAPSYSLSISKTGTGSGIVTSNPAGINCGSDCSENYSNNTSVTLTATPAAGSVFTGWTGGGCSGSGSCTLTMDSAKSVTANFNSQTFTLSVNKTGTGNGTITSNPVGINCGSDCSENYASATVVALSATPTLGHTFAGWSGDSDCSDGQVTMNASRTCTATFNIQNYTLTVTKTGSGMGTVTSSPAGINCGSTCSSSFNYNTVVTLSAIPAVGSTFTGWSGSGCSGTGTCTVTMTAAVSVTAGFDLQGFTLSISKTGNGSGTVTSNPPGINCGIDCSESYAPNTSVILTATSATGSTFTGWSGGGCSGTSTCSVIMTAATSITANFNNAPPPPTLLGNPSFEIDANNDGKPDVWSTNAKFTRSNEIAALDGSYVGRFRATDNSGATIQQVVQNLTAGRTYNFTGWVKIPLPLVTGDTFSIKIQVKWRNASNTVISTRVIKTYSSPTDPNVNNGWNEATATPPLVAPTGTTNALVQLIVSSLNGTIYVDKFSLVEFGSVPTHTLTVNKTGTGSGTVTSNPSGISCGIGCSEAYAANTNVTLTAVTDSGSIFIGWSGGGCSGTSTCTINLTANTSVTANFDIEGDDTTAPTVSWITPVSNEQFHDVGNETILLEVNASDNVGVSEVIFTRWDYINLVEVEIGRASSAPYRINFDTSTLLPDSNQINAYAFDAAGNSSDQYIWLNHISTTDLIFANSFEDDDCFTTQWTQPCVDDAGDLQFNDPPSPLKDNASMIITIDDNHLVYLTSDHPNAEPRYRARFYFDPNSISMVNGDLHRIFYGYNGTSKVVLRVEFRRNSNTYQLRAGLLTDSSSWTNSIWFTITDASHFVEFDWKASSATGANNGSLTLWIDGTQKPNLTGVDNDTWRIDRIRLGTVTPPNPGTLGTYYFDAFESRRQTYIGL